MIPLNLQFFAEGDNNDGNGDNNTGSASDSNNAGDGSNNTGDTSQQLDMQAFADIISDKDKEIEELRKDIAELKKSNANLIVRVNSGGNTTQEKSFEENLLEMVGAKPRKEK